MKIVLPYPPSANRYFRNYRGCMVMSADARMYKRDAAAKATLAGVVRMEGPLVVFFDFYRPQKSGDLDNFLKVCIDSLNGIVWKDDSQIIELRARRFEDKKAPRVEIEIMQVAPEEL